MQFSIRHIACASVAWGMALGGGQVHAQQWASEARALMTSPVKIAVKTSGQTTTSQPIDFAVQVQNGKNQPATLPHGTSVAIRLFSDKGEPVQSGSCLIKAAAAGGTCSVPAPKAGLYKIQAVPNDKQLLQWTGYLLVQPEAKRPAPKSELQKKPAQAPPHQEPNDAAARRLLPSGAMLLTVAWQPTQEQPSTPAPVDSCTPAHGPGRVIVAINEGGEDSGAFRADVEQATITAFFVADDNGAAPADIDVWLSPDHGQLDRRPLVIPRCTVSAETRLSSKYPVQASIAYAVTPSRYPIQSVTGSPRLQAVFTRPIVGVGIIPMGKQTISLIDRAPVIAQFFDTAGNPVPTDLNRNVKFVSNNSIIRAREESISVTAGGYSADTVLLPFWFGKSSLFVVADRIKPVSHDVEVVGLVLLFLCLLGGLAGGWIPRATTGLPYRLVVGVAGGLVLTWAYVFNLLPKVDTVVAHNSFSVLVVSLLGGYMGVKSLNLVLQLMGWFTNDK